MVMYFDLFDSSCFNVDLPFSRTRLFSIGSGSTIVERPSVELTSALLVLNQSFFALHFALNDGYTVCG